MVDRGTYMVGGLWTIDRGRDRGVAVGSSVVNLSISISISFCFCAGAGGHKGQNLRGKATISIDSMYWLYDIQPVQTAKTQKSSSGFFCQNKSVGMITISSMRAAHNSGGAIS